jgi:sugar/nucleoside kinase (ribokinase family)
VTRPIDILGLGAVAVDDLLYVPAYPPADSKVQVERRERHCGGLTATALVAASRLGARCAYAGTLGDDELSCFARRRLVEEGIDLTHTRQLPAARPVHSTIVVDQAAQTRTILFSCDGFLGAVPEWPADEVVASCRVLFVDHLGVPGMLRAARVARPHGIPVVADLENDDHPRFAELLAEVDHLIVSQGFALRLTGCPAPAAAAQALWTAGRAAVVVTCGAAGCWYIAQDEPAHVRHQPAFRVPVVDTTGCGDVFHGAYAAALVRPMDLAARVQFAAAAAALKATQAGGQAGIPRYEAVAEFLNSIPGERRRHS